MKRTKKKYQELFDNPAALFGPNARVTLWPNGEPEIWITNANGSKGVMIRASEGPACFSVNIKKHAFGTYDFTVLACAPDYTPRDMEPIRELDICQYNNDEVSQAFKRWYMADSNDKADKDRLRLEYEELEAKHPEYKAKMIRTDKQ